MHCPYCASDIAEEASVCAVCRRDLGLVKTLLARIAELETKLTEQAVLAVPAPAGEAVAEPMPDVMAPPPARSWAGIAANWLLPIALLLAAHWLVFFVYDARVIFLRLIALVLPLPFGVLFARSSRMPFGWSLVPAFAMAVVSVFAMSALTGWLDQVPVLPQNMVEVREFLEFAASIGLSFTTGLWVNAWMERRADAARVEAGKRLGVLALANGKKVTESITKLNDFSSAAVALGTTACSVYAGLKGVLGD